MFSFHLITFILINLRVKIFFHLKSFILIYGIIYNVFSI
jgi:hypothetical protein